MLRLDENTKTPVMYFNNDDEFYKFCVLPVIITPEYTKADGTIGHYADWDFTDAYKNAIRDGVHFVIKDENSQIYKHGELTYRVNTKPVQNLDPYYEDPFTDPDFKICDDCCL